jgi:hypothetical protein
MDFEQYLKVKQAGNTLKKASTKFAELLGRVLSCKGSAEGCLGCQRSCRARHSKGLRSCRNFLDPVSWNLQGLPGQEETTAMKTTKGASCHCCRFYLYCLVLL